LLVVNDVIRVGLQECLDYLWGHQFEWQGKQGKVVIGFEIAESFEVTLDGRFNLQSNCMDSFLSIVLMNDVPLLLSFYVVFDDIRNSSVRLCLIFIGFGFQESVEEVVLVVLTKVVDCVDVMSNVLIDFDSIEF
jgi:hypothetical protein